MSSTHESSPPNALPPSDSIDDWRQLALEQQATIQTLQQTIEQMKQQMQQQQGRIEQLEAEVRAQKKLKGKPKIRASRLNEPTEEEKPSSADKRAGSSKVSKKTMLEIKEEYIIEPDEIPAGARFKGYREYDIQELQLESYTIRFRLAEYQLEDGSLIAGELPIAYRNGHYGPLLLGYIVYQYYQCRVTQPLLYEQLQEWGIEISTGQLHNILSEHKEQFHAEQQDVLRTGLETAEYVHTDDTGARHEGKNGYCTVIGNEWFSYFRSSDSKSRQNFLEVLQGDRVSYVLNDVAKDYLEEQPLALKDRAQLRFSDAVLATSKEEWQAYLSAKGIVSVQAVEKLTQAALLGGVVFEINNPRLRILSDGAGQFNLLTHGLCWVHGERGLRRLQGETEQQRQNITQLQDLLWEYYQQLKQYQQSPTLTTKAQLWDEFDAIFQRCYLNHESLNKVLDWFCTHKAELLRVLDYPPFPLHNNAAETDIREYVIRRKLSGGTRSAAGRRARDTFVGLKKTCRKLEISFWQYLLSRFRNDQQIPPLADFLRARAAANAAPQVVVAI